MGVLFKAMGLLLAGYVIMAVVTGAVYAKSGVWGRTLRRMDRPLHYWSVIAAYIVLSVALIFWF